MNARPIRWHTHEHEDLADQVFFALLGIQFHLLTQHGCVYTNIPREDQHVHHMSHHEEEEFTRLAPAPSDATLPFEVERGLEIEPDHPALGLS